jgi:transketolase
MPSWDLFAAQPPSYRDEVLPPDVPKRLAVEAASPFGWERWVGAAGAVLGIDHFGASAPAKTLLKEFGFSADNVVARARALLGR